MFAYSAILISFLALPGLYAAPNSPKIEQIGSRFFYIEKDITLDWFEASRTCRRMGGELATIRSQEELELIVPKLQWDSGHWLSLNDLAEDSFVSLATGQPAPFSNWRRGQPDNYNFQEHCVALINYYMYDMSCYHMRRFICEM